jgi:hypothetical protein
MARRARRAIAQAAAVILLVTSVPVERAMADHDIKEAWTAYQDACGLMKIDLLLAELALGNYKDAQEMYYHCLMFMGHQDKSYCDVNAESMQRDKTRLEARKQALQKTQELCDLARANYSAAMTELVTELILTGSPPEAQTTSRPTRRTPSYTVRQTPSGGIRREPVERPPERGHSEAQTQAAAIIGGMVIQGIISGTRRGTRAPPSGGGGGTRCHHESATSRQHCN